MHFIAGLQRSGGTLLRSILRQNPFLNTGLGSPVYTVFHQVQAAVSRDFFPIAAAYREDQRDYLLRSVFHSYYNDPRRPIGIDTNRAWPTKLPLLVKLFPSCKIICMVRPMGEIVDSYERIFRDNPYEMSKTCGMNHTSIYERAAHLTSSNGVVGIAWNALSEGFYGQFAKHMLLVEYELLCRQPEAVMRVIYEFLELSYWDHDFENVEDLPDTDTHDAKIALKGVHTLRRRVDWQPVRPIIPPDLFNGYGVPFWYQDNPNNVPIMVNYKDGTDGTNGDGI